jgi:hypothetical protein
VVVVVAVVVVVLLVVIIVVVVVVAVVVVVVAVVVLVVIVVLVVLVVVLVVVLAVVVVVMVLVVEGLTKGILSEAPPLPNPILRGGRVSIKGGGILCATRWLCFDSFLKHSATASKTYDFGHTWILHCILQSSVHY